MIHNFLVIVFFLVVLASGFSSLIFIEKRPYSPSFVNMWYMVGNLLCFPTSCWQMVTCVTLDTMVVVVSVMVVLVWLVVCVSGGVAVCVWCDVDVMAISKNPCLWWWN